MASYCWIYVYCYLWDVCLVNWTLALAPVIDGPLWEYHYLKYSMPRVENNSEIISTVGL